MDLHFASLPGPDPSRFPDSPTEENGLHFYSCLCSGISLPESYGGNVPFPFPSGRQLLLVNLVQGPQFEQGRFPALPSSATFTANLLPATDIFGISSFPKDSESLHKPQGLESLQLKVSYERWVGGSCKVSSLCALP